MTQENQVKTNSFRAWLLAARPKTLTGAAVPVMIGAALAVADARAATVWWTCVLCFLFAFVMQIDANFVNDYFDFKRGNDDAATRLGPPRACSMGWITPRAMRIGLAVTTATGCLIGLPLVWAGGVEMIVVGALCVLFCFLYTTRLSYWGLGDVLVLLFFGLVPVSLTYYLMLPAPHQPLTVEVLTASVACGMVIDTLLLVNNYRDIDNDRRDGKRTLVVRIGPRAARLLYLWIGVAALVLHPVFAFHGRLWAILLPAVVFLPLHRQAYRHIVRVDRGTALNRVLGETARNMFVYGLTTALGILLSLV